MGKGIRGYTFLPTQYCIRFSSRWPPLEAFDFSEEAECKYFHEVFPSVRPPARWTVIQRDRLVTSGPVSAVVVARGREQERQGLSRRIVVLCGGKNSPEQARIGHPFPRKI